MIGCVIGRHYTVLCTVSKCRFVLLSTVFVPGRRKKSSGPPLSTVLQRLAPTLALRHRPLQHDAPASLQHSSFQLDLDNFSTFIQLHRLAIASSQGLSVPAAPRSTLITISHPRDHVLTNRPCGLALQDLPNSIGLLTQARPETGDLRRKAAALHPRVAPTDSALQLLAHLPLQQHPCMRYKYFGCRAAEP